MLSTILWLLWGAAFLVLELTAYVNARNGDTLSEIVWQYVTRPGSNAAVAWGGRVFLLAFLVWLAGHLAFGWWAP